MSTYGAESFYRATIRQSIDKTQTCPFSLKVSIIPTLTKGLLTISSNTSNEEIVEYDGTDGTSLTVTIVKRGISPSTQALSVNGTDYNNVTYQKSHSQNDGIRSDVTHLHIIQDYGSLDADKLDKVGGLRTGMTPNSLTENDGAGNEVQRTISSASPNPGDLIQVIDPSTRARREFTYSSIDLTGDTFVKGETINTFDPVGISPGNGKIYKVGNPSSSTTAIGSSINMFGTVVIDETRILGFYYTAANTFVRAGTVANDVVTWGTAVSVASGAATMVGACALIGTNTVALVSSPNVASATQNLTHTIVTISGTTITVGSNVIDTVTYPGSTNITELQLEPLRNDAYLVSLRQGSGSFPGQHVRLMNFTGTVPSFISQQFNVSDTAVTGRRIKKLADNVVAVANVTGNTSVVGCTIYTFSGNSVSSTSGTGNALLININSICKMSASSFMVTNNTTTGYLLTANGATLNVSGISFPSASSFLTYLGDNLYTAIVSGTIYVRQYDSTIATISGVSGGIDDTIRYDGGGRIYHIGNTATTIYNFMYGFHSGFCSATSKILSFLSYIVGTGFIPSSKYYLNPSNGLLSQTLNTGKYIGDAISSTKIQIKT